VPTVDFPGREAVWLPAQFEEFRPHQIDAVNEALDLYASGVDVVLLDAQTGAGKTLIGETIRIMHQSDHALYVCTTKGLQDQFLGDFDHARLIKGRANYPTYDNPEAFRFGLDASMCVLRQQTSPPPACYSCYEPNEPDTVYEGAAGVSHTNITWKHCDFCHPWQACPYREAKKEALHAPLAVANTAYFLHEANNVGGFSKQEFVIIDEADTLESLLMSFMGVSVSRHRLKRIGIQQPEKKTIASSWLPWSTDAVVALKASIKSLSGAINSSSGQPMYKLVKERDRVQRTLSGVVRFSDELAVDPDNWVYDGSSGGVEFKPVEVDRFGDSVLWEHAKNFLLMSATIISPASLMDFLGYHGTWATVKVDSRFNPERRPVWVCGAASMTYKTKDTEWPKMAEAVDAVLTRHPDLRILVHTVSYEFTSYLYDKLKGNHGARLLTYREAGERETTLERFRRSDAGVVLAPSFDRGVDLPGDEARVIVVTKVPFPFLGDKQVERRLFGTGIKGKTWYSMETIRSLVQMTGRGMRHKDDWCIGYILDRQFKSNVWKKRTLSPEWWAESLKWGPPTDGGAEAVNRAPVPARLT
jgi:Rad3-related DNA helicase